MKLEMKRVLLIVSIFLFSEVILTANVVETIQEKTANIVEILKQKGKFKSVKINNEVIGYRVEVFLDNKENASVRAESGLKEANSDDGFNFTVTKLENNEIIASGNIGIDLEWITKENKATFIKEVINKLKEVGVIVSFDIEAGAILVITIKKAPVEAKMDLIS